MKKIFALILACLMMFSLAACGGNTDSETTTAAPDAETAASDLAYIEDKGTLIVGITDYAQSELGEIVFVDINTEGETLEQNEVFGSVEAVKTVSDLNMPVAGEVLAINEAINDQPELVNNDPYGEGCMDKTA